MPTPSSIPLPAIRWGKRKLRSQMCEIFTDDGRIVAVEEDVLRGCVDDPATGQAFLLDAENQYTAEDGHWYQILGERSTIPLCMIKETNIKDLQKLINQIFHESQEDAKLRQYEKATSNTMADKLLWIVAMVLSAMVIIFGIVWFTG